MIVKTYFQAGIGSFKTLVPTSIVITSPITYDFFTLNGIGILSAMHGATLQNNLILLAEDTFVCATASWRGRMAD